MKANDSEGNDQYLRSSTQTRLGAVKSRRGCKARLARSAGDKTVAAVQVVGGVVAGGTTKTTTAKALTEITARPAAETATATAVGVRNAAGHVEDGCGKGETISSLRG